MADCTQKHLKKINKVSRQLLSRILATHNNIQLSPLKSNLEITEEQLANRENKELAELTELSQKRQILITKLFKNNTAEKMNAESELVQEMIALDIELTANAKSSKQLITEQVLKVKKSKKITKSYQKY
ncbi:hypothetical protein [Colwellia hornerae]|uniref:Uncharacterized protein n=1 Tax=Colwellia hornerae TaxID=89402 RepID=A0A5C6QKP2_9GAMM|nr:hypothetical protein [Colwellia hornerae]TWX54132.1 hypothetical protein ESZ28_08780 [Colwellia hornerae]TWX60907.1 hypothetical protein ESZ26_07555 [Colwellia hornerae]TWX69237.1 hypothetical protein ESZ27_06315 [Colwellia hornerae]